MHVAQSTYISYSSQHLDHPKQNTAGEEVLITYIHTLIIRKDKMSKVFYFLWIRHYYFLLYRLLAMWNIYKCVYNVQKIMNLNEINVYVFLTLRYFEFYIFSYFNFGAAGIKCKHTCSLTFQICCQLHYEKKNGKDIIDNIIYH